MSASVLKRCIPGAPLQLATATQGHQRLTHRQPHRAWASQGRGLSAPAPPARPQVPAERPRPPPAAPPSHLRVRAALAVPGFIVRRGHILLRRPVRRPRGQHRRYGPGAPSAAVGVRPRPLTAPLPAARRQRSLRVTRGEGRAGRERGAAPSVRGGRGAGGEGGNGGRRVMEGI